jgi:hypothetical protein
MLSRISPAQGGAVAERQAEAPGAEAQLTRNYRLLRSEENDLEIEMPKDPVDGFGNAPFPDIRKQIVDC